MKHPVHPGAILREDVLAELGFSVSDAAESLGGARVTLAEERAAGIPKVRKLGTVA
jgi:plasmid maintenance system antidote protein VapI